MNPIGKKIRIVGKHPHQGETGVVEWAEGFPFGSGYIVKLDHCPHGTVKCFVSEKDCIYETKHRKISLILAIVLAIEVSAIILLLY